jgi:hypothetical protein
MKNIGKKIYLCLFFAIFSFIFVDNSFATSPPATQGDACLDYYKDVNSDIAENPCKNFVDSTTSIISQTFKILPVSERKNQSSNIKSCLG